MSINGKNGQPASARIARDLTIVIPAYRCAKYLPAAIESALDSNPAEVLVSTDGGGLEEPRVAGWYAAKYPGRVRLLAHRRRNGAAKNVNLAAQQVRTPYFAKLDGDDVLMPRHLETALQLFAEHPSLSIVAGRDRRIAAGDFLAFDRASMFAYEPDASPTVLSHTAAFRFIVTWAPNPCSSGCIYRTEAFRQVGGFDPRIPWGEDWEIWLRLAQRWEVGYCDAVSALYRIHPQSSTATQSRQHRLCFGYDAVYRRAAMLCPDPALAPLLRRSLRRVAGMYAAAAARQTLRLRPDGLVCAQRAVRALARSISLPPPEAPSPFVERGRARASAGSS
jgi:glycosyltransferase involved in cell wall biosynthesis